MGSQLVSLVLKCWELTPLCWDSVIQPACKDAIVKLGNKQQPPYLGEGDDVFSLLQINQLIQKSTMNRVVEHHA